MIVNVDLCAVMYVCVNVDVYVNAGVFDVDVYADLYVYTYVDTSVYVDVDVTVGVCECVCTCLCERYLVCMLI